MTILYADDDPDDREIFADVVAEINPEIELILVTDGTHAIETLNNLSKAPDVIFLDVNMPLLSGIECVTILRKDERFKRAPLILYSTSSSELDAYKGLKAGADKFLTKAASYRATFEMLKGVFASVSNIKKL